ncbi:MAG: tRNA (adenosine(37)-N6)-threonylcarbamoyltransferase complex dimerization subunit type 1 TsaB [Patescibacteria group bacterium]
MNTLVIDTSDKTARFGLFKDDNLTDKLEWKAHKELSKTFYLKLDELLGRNKLKYNDLDSIIVVCGPGSFTGLRIGIVIVNTFSYALGIETAGVIQKEKTSLSPVIPARQRSGKHPAGIQSLTDKLQREPRSIEDEKMSLEEIYNVGGRNLKKEQIIEPFYGREPNITIKKKR